MEVTEIADMEISLRNCLFRDAKRTFPAITDISKHLDNSEWSKILSLESFEPVLSVFKTEQSYPDVLAKLETLLMSGMKSQLELTALAVSSLQLFVAINWTGLKHVEKDCQYWLDEFGTKEKLLEEALIEDGESLVPVAKCLDLLLIARSILTLTSSNIYSRHWVFLWWKFRSSVIHQTILTEKSEMLHSEVLKMFESFSENTEFLTKLENEVRTRVHFELEKAQFFANFYDVVSMGKCLEHALSRCGLQIAETGVMGKRTKFQIRDLPQMTLDINVDNVVQEDEGHKLMSSDHLPVDIKLDDEARLDKIKFASERKNADNLSLLHQAVILSLYTMKDRSMPQDELSHEEHKPYLDAILDAKSQCWSLKMSALLFRSKLESSNRRTAERSMMQVQTLVDSLSENCSDTRMELIYSSRLPPFWQIEQTLCQTLQAMGSIKAALDVALRVQLWDDVIHCYHQLQLRHKAAEVIRAELKKKETPLLYCMLGDATDELEHYHKALEMTNNRNARAFRSLGLYYYFRHDYDKAIEFLGKSVELNSFQLQTILRLGFAATQKENWELAAQMYRKYCSYESDNFEAWNNLSNAYIKMGQKARAWKVLQEAVKCDYDNWKIWDNIMLVSTDCAHFEDVVRSYQRILDLKEKHVDLEVLDILVRAVIEDREDNQGQKCRRLLAQTLNLLGRLTSQVTTEGKLWEFYSDLTLAKDEKDPVKVTQFMQKALACVSQKTGWEKDTAKCKEVLQMAEKHSHLTMSMAAGIENSAQAIQVLSSAKMSIRGILTKVKQSQTSVETGEIVGDVLPLFQSVSNKLEEIQQTITSMKL